MSIKIQEIDLSPLGVGTSRKFKISVVDTTGGAIDVSGDKFYFTIKKLPETEDAAADVQVNVVAPVDANSVNGIVFITALAADTAGVSPGTYQYDCMWLKLTSAPGEREPVQRGEISFYQPVTATLT
jgi:hypothetical protein